MSIFKPHINSNAHSWFDTIAWLSFIFLLGGVVTGCSDDKNEIIYPISEICKQYDAEHIELTLNGTRVESEYFQAAFGMISDDAPAYEGSMKFKATFVSIPHFADAANPSSAFTLPDVDVTVRNVNGYVTFEGVYDDGGCKINIAGTITDPASEHSKMTVTVDYDYSKYRIVGRTFELSFDDSSLYPSFYSYKPDRTVECDGTVYNQEEAFQLIFSILNTAYRTNTGYDRAKITFKPNGDLDLYFRNASTGEYGKSEYRHRYMFYRGYLLFLNESDFIDLQRKQYTVDNGLIPSYFFTYFTKTGNSDIYTVPGAMLFHQDYSTETGTLYLKWINPNIYYETKGFFSSGFSRPFGINLPTADLCIFAIGEEMSGNITYDVVAKLREVS